MANLIDLLLADHAKVRALFDSLATATGSERESLFAELRQDLVQHEVAEEEIVRPLTRQSVPQGGAIADARVDEEAHAETLLAKLEKADVGSGDWDELLAELRKGVLAHAEREEDEEFPALRANVPADRLDKLGAVLELAKQAAPTHPHPATPNTATANLLLGPLAAVTDRARDAVTKALQKISA